MLLIAGGLPSMTAHANANPSAEGEEVSTTCAPPASLGEERSPAPSRPDEPSRTLLVPSSPREVVELLSSGQLLTTTQLNEVLARAGPTPEQVQPLLLELVRRQWLTPFQVGWIQEGRGADLCLDVYTLLE